MNCFPTGEKRSTEFLFQRISVEIERGNAISVLGTHPATRGLVFILFSNFLHLETTPASERTE